MRGPGRMRRSDPVRRPDPLRRRRGFTLIELMISVAILGFVAVYLLQTFTVNHQAYVVLDQNVESQQNLRALGDLIERDVRHAGLMVPTFMAACGVDSTSGPDVLYVSDHEAIDPGDDVLSYEGADITSGSPTGGATVTLDLAEMVIEPAPDRPAFDNDGDGDTDTDFREGGGVIVADRLNPDRGVLCGNIRNVDVANDKIQVDVLSGSLGSLAGVEDLVVVPAIEYRIGGGRQLLRNGQPLADGIEDLQVAWLFDTDLDGTVDAVRGDQGGTVYDNSELDVDGLRSIRVNVVARSRLEDPKFHTGALPALENRPAGGSDGFRRRLHTATIMPRNLVNRMAGI
jgi:prepilin-type N-terminal cleavage/methylation domain-containing protein